MTRLREYGKKGKLTAPFPVEKGVRQGCVLAPTLFSLFLNGLIDILLAVKDADPPKLANRKIPALMFADDTLLLSKSPIGMQWILEEFCKFCRNWDLEINPQKAKYMIFHAKTTNCPYPQMEGRALERTSIFDYLGITLNDKMDWETQVKKANLKLTQSIGGILKVHKNCTQKVVGPPVEIYKTQARGMALYGAEMWGHCPTNALSSTENTFLRRLLDLPRSSPLIPLRMDLGIGPIADIIASRPLLFWRRLWSTPELVHYRVELKDVIAILGVGKIPWLAHIRHLCQAMGRENMWLTPEESCRLISKKSLSLACKEYKLAHLLQSTNLGSLTSRFLDVKHQYKIELALDSIQPFMAKKGYLQFRHGALPLRAFTNNWKGAIKLDCPGCNAVEETDLHVLLFCPAYSRPRVKWVLQLCNNMGIRHHTEAYRLLKYETHPFFVFATSRFLFSMWCIRRGIIKRKELEKT